MQSIDWIGPQPNRAIMTRQRPIRTARVRRLRHIAGFRGRWTPGTGPPRIQTCGNSMSRESERCRVVAKLVMKLLDSPSVGSLVCRSVVRGQLESSMSRPVRRWTGPWRDVQLQDGRITQITFSQIDVQDIANWQRRSRTCRVAIGNLEIARRT